jgi:hypothetical protein
VDNLLGGVTYANVHTLLHPNGEIRDQILSAFVPVPPPVTIPPTSTTGTAPPTLIIGTYGARQH